MKTVGHDSCLWAMLTILGTHFIELLLRFPCNHANVLKFPYRNCIIAVIIIEIIIMCRYRHFCPSVWILFVLSFFIPTVEDRYNILLPYTEWAQRGMPEWGERGRTKDEIIWNKIGGEEGIHSLLFKVKPAFDGREYLSVERAPLLKRISSFGAYRYVSESVIVYVLPGYRMDSHTCEGLVLIEGDSFSQDSLGIFKKRGITAKKQLSESCFWCEFPESCYNTPTAHKND